MPTPTHHGTEPCLDSGYTPEQPCGGTLVVGAGLVCAACNSTIAHLCAGCKDPVDYENDPTYDSRDGEAFCVGCFESEMSHPSVVTAIGGEHHGETVRFTEHFTFGVDGDDEEPEWFTGLFVDSKPTRIWHQTDAWRGYFDTSKAMTATSIVDGWVTGDYDDVPWKRDTHRFAAALTEHGHDAPVSLYVLTEPTSNVFSTAADILVAEADKAQAVEWIGSLGFTLDALERAFG